MAESPSLIKWEKGALRRRRQRMFGNGFESFRLMDNHVKAFQTNSGLSRTESRRWLAFTEAVHEKVMETEPPQKYSESKEEYQRRIDMSHTNREMDLLITPPYKFHLFVLVKMNIPHPTTKPLLEEMFGQKEWFRRLVSAYQEGTGGRGNTTTNTNATGAATARVREQESSAVTTNNTTSVAAFASLTASTVVQTACAVQQEESGTAHRCNGAAVPRIAKAETTHTNPISVNASATDRHETLGAQKCAHSQGQPSNTCCRPHPPANNSVQTRQRLRVSGSLQPMVSTKRTNDASVFVTVPRVFLEKLLRKVNSMEGRLSNLESQLGSSCSDHVLDPKEQSAGDKHDTYNVSALPFSFLLSLCFVLT